MSDSRTVCETPESCMEKGHCAVHGVEIERRKQTSKSVEEIKNQIEKFEHFAETEHKTFNDKISVLSSKLNGIATTLGLLLLITLGSYYYVNVVDYRNNRGEEILLNKINNNANHAKVERDALVSQIVSLLTTSAEQKEWQRGMMRQMELLNSHIRDIANLKEQNEKTL